MSCHPGASRSALAGFVLLAFACRSVREPVVSWQQDIAHEAKAPAQGCALGDLEPGRPGDEIAVACANGEILVLAPRGGGWTSDLVYQAEGEMLECATGELDPEHAGAELVFAGALAGQDYEGGPGVVYLARFLDPGWSVEELFEDVAPIRALVVGDLDPEHPGDEVLVAGASGHAHVLESDAAGWRVDRIGDLPGEAVGAACDCGTAIVACADGSILSFEHSESGWITSVIDWLPAAPVRIAALDGWILCPSLDGALRLIVGNQTRTIHHSRQILRGAVIADLVPAWPGAECATAGEDGSVVVLHQGVEKGWIATEVVMYDDDVRGLAVGCVGGKPFSLVSACSSGEVIVAWPGAIGR
jgi:hypothetical protein